ncbi:MAG TPA: Gfo/Idh/MocA family oxidoreductase [Polyangiaceae bacterium]|jgi:predicted dehydrogenase|nr:Gfo/Idh/MocA family oxidoreductase [Polyangiaceae bacterium]
MNPTNHKVRYAVIGAGNIAQSAVLPAFKHASENSELVALISSDSSKRAELRKRYAIGLEGDYPDLERILAEGDIDAVYIATPNSTHQEFAERAADAGVHVLCEKPLAPTVARAEAMARACERAEVKLMVAYRLHFERATLSALDVLRQGKIGDPLLFCSSFSHTVRPGDIRRDSSAGGGVTLDLGVYCINAARHVFAAEPLSVFAWAIEKDGVDDTLVASLKFSRGRSAQFSISNSTSSVSSYRIMGTDGDLRVEPAYEYAEGLQHFLTVEEQTHHRSFPKSDQFAPEIMHFSDCILHDHEPKPSAAEAIADLRVIEALLESVQTGRPVTLEPRQIGYQPQLSQAAHKPPVKKPEPIHAPSPSIK